LPLPLVLSTSQPTSPVGRACIELCGTERRGTHGRACRVDAATTKGGMGAPTALTAATHVAHTSAYIQGLYTRAQPRQGSVYRRIVGSPYWDMYVHVPPRPVVRTGVRPSLIYPILSATERAHVCSYRLFGLKP
jgi:hypothetical protein